MEHAQKIVAEFEGIFGTLSATERDWLTRRIAAGAKAWADVVLSEENDRLIARRGPACPDCEGKGGIIPGITCATCEGSGELPKQDPRYQPVTEENCPGHVASKGNPKVCGRCGVHIDSFRPDEWEGE